MLIKKNMSDEEMDAFLLYIEEMEMIEAPGNLKEKILRESENKKIQTELEQKRKQHSAKIQFLLYSLKISAGVIAAVFLLAFIDTDSITAFSMPERINERKTVVTYLNEKSNEWSYKLNQFSKMLY